MSDRDETATVELLPPIEPGAYSSEYYQTLNRGYSQFVTGELHPKLLKAAQLVRGSKQRIVDVGCGRGEFAVFLAQAGHEVVGVDYSPSALQYAKTRMKKLPATTQKRLQFLERDAKNLGDISFTGVDYRLPATGVCDYVFMLDLIEHLHPWELEGAITEAYRILKPGGQLVLHTSPNRTLMAPARAIGRLFGITTRSEAYHINEQSAASINEYLTGFTARTSLERDRQFWSWQVEKGHRLKPLLSAVDFVFDFPLWGWLFDTWPLNLFFATDIWTESVKDSHRHRPLIEATVEAKLKVMLSKVGDLNFRRRIIRIVEGLNIRPGDKILDAGCGEGFYVMLLHQLYPENEIFGLDFDPKLVALAKGWVGQSPKVDIQVGSLLELPFADHSFDKVVCSEVFEHIVEHEAAARQVFRVMKPGGKLAVTVPNANYPFLWDPINFIREKVLRLGHFNGRNGFWGGIWAYDHQRLYTPHDLKTYLSKVGFSVLDVRALTHFGVPANHLVLYLGKQFYTRLPVPEAVRKEMEKFEWKDQVKAKKKSFSLNPFKLALGLLEAADRLNEARHDEHDFGVTAMVSYALVEKPAPDRRSG